MSDRKIILMANLPLESLGKGKGGRAFITTLNAYINDDWDVYLVISNTSTPEELRTKVHLYERVFSKRKIEAANNPITRKLQKFSYASSLTKFFYDTAKGIVEDISTEHVVVYAYEVWAVSAAKKISNKYNIPLITRFQGTVHANTKDSLINRIKYVPHLSALKCEADLVIMTNDGTQGLKTLKRLGNESKNIKFWMNGITLPSLPSPDYIKVCRSDFGFDNKFVFLTVSRLVNWKKVDRAIDAFSAIYTEIPSAELHIIGDGEEKESLEALSRRLGVSDRVVFHGSIPHSEVAKYMTACDVFMSLYDLSNVGNPLLEAMSVGKPIITLNNGDTGEFIHDNENGALIDPTNLGRLPKEMKRLYVDESFRQRIAKEARSFAEAHFWSWEKRMNSEIVEVNKLLNR